MECTMVHFLESWQVRRPPQAYTIPVVFNSIFFAKFNSAKAHQGLILMPDVLLSIRKGNLLALIGLQQNQDNGEIPTILQAV